MMKNRNYFADVEKFIAALLIMALHRSVLGYENDPFYFKDAWIFVEFFLIISGYYTSEHFAQVHKSNDKKCFKSLFVYVIKKYISFLPYVMISVLVQWVIFGLKQLRTGIWGIGDFVAMLMGNFPFEMLLINTAEGGQPFVIPLWYLMALMIALPIFILILICVNDKWLRVTISFIYCSIYYGTVGVKGIIWFPHCLPRMIAGLCIGLLIYEISKVFENWFKNISVILLSIIAFLTMALCIALTMKSTGQYRIMLLCMIINLSVILPNYISVSVSGIIAKLATWLGRISMPMYITHWVVGTIIEMCFGNTSNEVRLICYYIVSIGVSILLLRIFDKLKPFNRFLKCLDAI